MVACVVAGSVTPGVNAGFCVLMPAGASRVGNVADGRRGATVDTIVTTLAAVTVIATVDCGTDDVAVSTTEVEAPTAVVVNGSTGAIEDSEDVDDVDDVDDVLPAQPVTATAAKTPSSAVRANLAVLGWVRLTTPIWSERSEVASSAP